MTNPFFLSSDLFRKFLSFIDPLKGFLGPVIFQFEYLNKMKMPSPKMFRQRFGDFLDQIPSNYVYGLEVRNKNYFNKGYFDFLLERGLAPVLIEGYWMPPIAELFQKWGDAIRKHPMDVIRLMGKDRKGIEAVTGNKWDRIVERKDDELKMIADIVKDFAGNGVEVYLNVNNHYKGCAPATIERIESILGE